MEVFQEAVISEDVNLLSSLLSSSPWLVNVPVDDEDTTLLHLAANTTTLAILHLLLQHGAEINKQNDDGLTPLHVAAMWGNREAVRILLDYGADAMGTDDEDLTPLDHAMNQDHSSCSKLLQEHIKGLQSEDDKDDEDDEGYGEEEVKEEGAANVANMSMAEAFVSMYNDEYSLTQVTELLDLTESHDTLTKSPDTLTESPDTLTKSPDTPIAHDTAIREVHPDTPVNITVREVCSLSQSHAASGAENTASDSRLGAENTAPDSRAGAENTASDSRAGAENTASYSRAGAENTASDSRAGAENTASDLRLGAENTASDSRAGAENTASDLRLGAENTASDSRSGAENTASDSRLRAENTASDSRAGAENTASDSRLRAENTASDSRSGAENTASDSRLGAENTASDSRLGAKNTALDLRPGDAGSPLLQEEKKLDLHHSSFYWKKKNPRRELFPCEDGIQEVVDKTNSSLYFSAIEEDLKDTSLLSSTSLSSQQSCSVKAVPTHEHSTAKNGLLSSEEREAAKREQPSTTSQIPQWILKMTNRELREKLISLGEQPGPVDDSTRSAYQTYLSRIVAGIQPEGNRGYKGYKYELALVLNGTTPIPKLNSLEGQVFHFFRNSSASSSLTRSLSSSSSSSSSTTCSTPPQSPLISLRNNTSARRTPRTPRGHTKDHFNYLLLDPLMLERMDTVSSDLEHFRTFVEAVFYVGKGKNSRSMQHLKDARDCTRRTPAKVSNKLRQILKIWSCGRGVLSLQVFHNTTADEAFTREACLIEAIGLDNLTNVQRGHVYGEVCGWRMGKRRQFGVHLLHKAFQTYLIDPPLEIYQHDL